MSSIFTFSKIYQKFELCLEFWFVDYIAMHHFCLILTSLQLSRLRLKNYVPRQLFMNAILHYTDYPDLT